MRNYTHYALMIAALLSFCFAAHGQPVEKILVKSFNLQGNQLVALNVDAPVEVQAWNNNFLRVQMSISLDYGSDALLKSLVQAGRYNLRYELEEGTYKIIAPDLDREIKIGDRQIEDKVSFLVYAPENVIVQLPENIEKEAVSASSSL